MLHDERLRELFDLKIFVQADADERILRRALRDIKERGRDLEGITRQYLSTVKPMHNLFVKPSSAHADIILNSAFNVNALLLVENQIKNVLCE